jgi:hypothetical protein
MQDASDASENAEPDEVGQPNVASSAGDDDRTPGSDVESVRASTVVAEVRPGVAVVFGEVPPALERDLIDFGLVPTTDREQISTVLASIGNTATAGGNLANALGSARGLYRITDSTRALLNAGGTLAVKDGANLGAILLPGGGLAQARFIPLAAVSGVAVAAAIGPALAMVALQMSLTQVTGLVRTNIALTSQVMATIRTEQWSELTGLVDSIDSTVDQAQRAGDVATSLWNKVAPKEADLRKERDLYQRNVRDHIRKINQLSGRSRREYLETNAEAIFFDTTALMSSLKAWLGYQALHAAWAKANGSRDAAEARLFEVIARDTPEEFDSALLEITSLIDWLTRELRIIAELPGRGTLPLSRRRKDSEAARLISARILKAIQPLADALHPPAPPLEIPEVVCAPSRLNPGAYLRILRWHLEDRETLRCLAFPHQRDEGEVIKDVGQRVLGGIDAEKWATRIGVDPAIGTTLVAVTDRRIITAKPDGLLQEGEIDQSVSLDRIRYVRSTAKNDQDGRARIDLITRDKDIRWLFQPDLDTQQVDALAAVLAESMSIPDTERDELAQRPYAALLASNTSESGGATT